MLFSEVRAEEICRKLPLRRDAGDSEEGNEREIRELVDWTDRKERGMHDGGFQRLSNS